MTGRSVNKWTRVYIDGYDVSGHTRTAGPLTWEFETNEEAAYADAVKGSFPGLATMNIGTVNAFFDNTASTGFHVLESGAAGTARQIMVAQGMRAAPAIGDPVFCVQNEQKSYMADLGSVMSHASVTFGDTARDTVNVYYPIPWGTLLHIKTAETGVNSANGIADLQTPASTSFGGTMFYQVFAGNGTATIKIQDATTAGGAYADITNLTTGVIDCSNPTAGQIAIAKSATIRQYLRWQIVLGTATSVTFALAFIRGYDV